MVTCGGIVEYSVTYAAGSGEPADREPASEDADVTYARALRTTGGTHDDKKYSGLMDLPVGNSINKCLMR